MNATIAVYRSELERWEKAKDVPDVNSFVTSDSTKISWNRGLKNDFAKGKKLTYKPQCVVICCYRPFTKQWGYFDRDFNDMVYRMPKIFPITGSDNQAIVLPGPGEDRPFSTLICGSVPDLHFLHGGQAFPLYWYGSGNDTLALFENEKSLRHSSITSHCVSRFQNEYVAANVAQEDLFYYIYGLLHSPEYRERYKDNLSKELPRIPAVKKFEDFQAFSQAGRDLAHWHLDYETVDCYPATIQLADGSSGEVDKRGAKHDKLLKKLTDDRFYVRRMKFAKTKDPATGKTVHDRSTVIYNDFITVKNIPLDAYDYVVNGKSAIEWVIERQAVTTDKDSGIVNDANLWATETMNNAAYPLELLLRVINVSLETNKIVSHLPKLVIA